MSFVAAKMRNYAYTRSIQVSCQKLHTRRMSLYSCLMRQLIAKEIYGNKILRQTFASYVISLPNDVSFQMCFNCPQGLEHKKLAIKNKFTQLKTAMVLLLLTFVLNACAATQVAIEKKDLNVTSTMTTPMFVTPGLGSNVYLRVANTTPLKVSSETLQLNVAQQLQAKGYQVTSDPNSANYILQAQLLDATAEIIPARQLASSHDGAAAGAVAGALIGATANTWKATGVGAGIGALAGGIAETIASSAVKAATYHLTVALQVTEPSTGKTHQTQITVNAEKVQLKPEEALTILTENTCKAIAAVL